MMRRVAVAYGLSMMRRVAVAGATRPLRCRDWHEVRVDERTCGGSGRHALPAVPLARDTCR
eukprot:2333406-Prymnesium_polylepis.1